MPYKLLNSKLISFNLADRLFVPNTETFEVLAQSLCLTSFVNDLIFALLVFLCIAGPMVLLLVREQTNNPPELKQCIRMASVVMSSHEY